MISRLIFILCITICNTVYANITCSNPKLARSGGKNDIYHFKATVICKITDGLIKLDSIKKSYLDEIEAKNSQFVVHSKTDYSEKNKMDGYKLDVTQSYRTEHGPLKLRANVIIADNKTNDFEVKLQSKSVVGKGDTANTKSIQKNIHLNINDNQGDLSVTKEIDVNQPWYAPDSMFFSSVESDLRKSIQKSAFLHAEKITGKNTKPLHD